MTLLFWPIRLAFRLVSLIVLAAVIYVVYSGVEVVLSSRTTSNARSISSSSAIVVLPTKITGTSPGPDFLGRLKEAAALYSARRAPTVVVASPAATRSEPSGASVARHWLVNNGVPSSAILFVRADNSLTALSRSAALLGSRKHVIIVTDAIDAHWTKSAASADGLKATIAPGIGSKKFLFEELGALWRQSTAVAAGRIIGYGHTGWAAG